MTKPAGTVVDSRYRIVRFLGQGSFGEVYEVEDLHQAQHVALKFLKPGRPGTWDEAQILTNLRSQYILPVWNADFDAGVPYLVTDLAPYGSVDSHMVPGVPPETAVRWVRSAARGATRAHDVGLLHRDIKPDNIFLTAAGEALLGDFGIACLMDPNGYGPYGGTLTTMSPEVAAGGNTSVASDVYSLGATLYALLAGQYANYDPDAAAMRALVVRGIPVPIRDAAPHVSLALAQRVQRAMALNPADRYPSPAAFDADLGRLPATARHWYRSDEHPIHVACWRGEARGRAAVTVCLNAVGTRGEVIAQHQPSGRRITAASRGPAPASAWPRNVRAAIAAAS